MSHRDRLSTIITGIEKNPQDVVKCILEFFEDEHLNKEFFEDFINSKDYHAVSKSCQAAIEIILAVLRSEDPRYAK